MEGTRMAVEIGQQISHYKILEKLGEGGMGVVYKSHDDSLNRPVALKFLPPNLTKDETTRKRFVIEAQAASALDHPNICNIHEIDETDDGQQYICMAYYEGESLRQKIKKSPIPVDIALNIFIQLTQGMVAAHEKNIIHRDIKPGNVIITDNGEVKIVDFGLAKLAGVDLTQSTSSKGTAAYMCPEQITGEGVDHRCDIWALGIVLYEMLTGHLPFDGEYPEQMLYAIVNKNPKPLSEFVKNYPELLQKVISKCLENDPSDRYQQLSDLLIDLKPMAKEAGLIVIKKKHAFVELLKRKKRFLYSTIAALILVSTFWISWPYLIPDPPRGNKIAILPMKNPLIVEEQEWFTKGMAAGINTKLSQISGLIVKHQSSSGQYWETSKSPTEIAADLDVDYILEISTDYKEDQSYKLSVKLIDPLKNDIIWSHPYEREAELGLRLQAKIAQDLATQIRVEPTKQVQKDFAATRLIDPITHEFYLKGMYYLNKFTPDGIKTGLDYLNQIVITDPEEPLTYAALAVAYSMIAHLPSPPPDASDRSRENALKAIELDETLAEAHLALAMVKIYEDWDMEGAEKSYKRAMELDPCLPLARAHYGWFLLIFNEYDKALEEFRLAKELDPLSPQYYADYAWANCNLGNYDITISEAQRSLELNPNDPYTLSMLGNGYTGKGMYERAIKEYKKAAEFSTDWNWALAIAYIKSGQREEALKIARDLEDKDKIWDTWCLAVIYATLGERDKFFYWLEAAYQQRHPFMLWMKTEGTYFGDYYDDPQFITMAKKLNLVE